MNCSDLDTSRRSGLTLRPARNFRVHGIVRPNTIEIADGDWLPAEVCAFEFESLQKAKEFYNSAEYQAVIADRLETTVSSVIFIDGGSGMAP